MRWLTTMSIALLMYAMMPAVGYGSQMRPSVPGTEASLGIRSTTGDNPLTTAYVARGHLNVAVVGVALGGAFDPPGTLTVSGLPDGSSVLKAYFYGSEWGYTAGATATATLGGMNLGTAPPVAHDPSDTWDLAVYRWDATAAVPGNGSYSFTTDGLQTVYGAVLVVIYSNTDEPYRQVVVNDGAESLQVATSTTTLSMDGAGPGVLTLFTVGDDAQGWAESITFNGADIAGPGGVFSGNLGSQASLLSYPVDTVAGDNLVTVAADVDWFGWQLTILAAQLPKPDTDPPSGDRDGDGVADGIDRCPDLHPQGADANGDGCPDTIQNLRDVIDETPGVQDKALPSLYAKIDSAQTAANSGDYCAAVGGLGALKNYISAQTGKRITAQAADLLQRYVDNVIAELKAQMPAGQSC